MNKEHPLRKRNLKDSDKTCNKWKEGQGRGYSRFRNCTTCDMAGYGVCCYAYPDEIVGFET